MKSSDDQIALPFAQAEGETAERLATLQALDALEPGSNTCRARYLTETVGRIILATGRPELTWTVERLAARLSLPTSTTRQTIRQAEQLRILTTRRTARADGSNDVLALAPNWHSIAARQFLRSLPAPPPDPPLESSSAPAGIQQCPRWNPAETRAKPQRAYTVPGTGQETERRKTPSPLTAWTPEEEEEVLRALKAAGCNSGRLVIRTARKNRITPDALAGAIRTYQQSHALPAGTPGRLRTPGAILFWTENQAWPDPCAANAEETADRQARSSAARLAARAARDIIRDGRRRRLPDQQITDALHRAGFTWETAST